MVEATRRPAVRKKRRNSVKTQSENGQDGETVRLGLVGTGRIFFIAASCNPLWCAAAYVAPSPGLLILRNTTLLSRDRPNQPTKSTSMNEMKCINNQSLTQSIN